MQVWLLAAEFELRQKDVAKARKLLGAAIGMCPKAKLYRGYIDLETQLREFHRCRLLYEKFLLFDRENCAAWMKFAELETLLGIKLVHHRAKSKFKGFIQLLVCSFPVLQHSEP